ncbi:hypothetical protein MAIT1_03981 [Magnetofaba australis IT-1]|uniref:Uncharacterized protein n=1 Tax=Magnetofaba australis IT-1 TaxID=1434232 RepID=A0A1Y2K8N9_9PROT|nr:hypothetical protein MAIT1_03981 [Magnetofaba australis IT-1]
MTAESVRPGDGMTAQAGDAACPIRIRGQQSDGKELATLWRAVELQPGAHYRLQGWVKLNAYDDRRFPPRLALSARNAAGKSLKNYDTETYDMADWPGWSRLLVDFQADPAAQSGKLLLKHKKKLPIAADICLKEITLQRFDAPPPPLRLSLDVSEAVKQRLGGPRPRLFVTAQRVQALRKSLDTVPFDRFWRTVQARAHKEGSAAPPASATRYDSDAIRGLGEGLPYLALAYLMRGQDNDLAMARRWMDALASYPDWADNSDIGAALLLMDMSIAYDWLHDQWSPAERERYRAKIALQAERLYKVLINHEMWWSNDYLQNHNYTSVMGLGLAGYALYGEDPNAASWLAAAERNFTRVLRVLSPDGASHEGINYWGFGIESLLRYHLGVAPAMGLERVKSNPYMQHAAKYRLHAALPGYRDNVDYADAPRFEWHGPGYILRALARIYQDGVAQWLADSIEAARARDPAPGSDGAGLSWEDLLWYDPAVGAVEPDGLPTNALFDNLGLMMARDGWGDDAAWVFFKGGSPGGDHARKHGMYPGSHIHPDAGQVMLWADGRWLLNDDGYVLLKRAANHNVITINGVGQLGEGEKWFDWKAARNGDAHARIIRAESLGQGYLTEAELAGAYPARAGLASWRRTVRFEPEQHSMQVEDAITLSRAGTIRYLMHMDRAAAQAGEMTYCLSSNARATLEAKPALARTHFDGYAIAPKERKREDNGNYRGMRLSAESERVEKQHFVWRVTWGEPCQAAAAESPPEPEDASPALRRVGGASTDGSGDLRDVSAESGAAIRSRVRSRMEGVRAEREHKRAPRARRTRQGYSLFPSVNP